ncbi:MAG: hypothetical protein H0T69_08005 [Thermoleophilaceae bacterium]|nr:hypothetical protein [Thermoleophilaceae bacterium]
MSATTEAIGRFVGSEERDATRPSPGRRDGMVVADRDRARVVEVHHDCPASTKGRRR